MKTLKGIFFIVVIIIMLLLLLITAFGPIILGFITGNWWFIALYAVIWSIIWIEIVVFGTILAAIGYSLDL